MSDQMKASLARATIMGAIAAATAVIAWLNAKPEYAVGASIAAAFLTRFVAEGGYDTQRDKSGDVKPSDVSMGSK